MIGSTKGIAHSFQDELEKIALSKALKIRAAEEANARWYDLQRAAGRARDAVPKEPPSKKKGYLTRLWRQLRGKGKQPSEGDKLRDSLDKKYRPAQARLARQELFFRGYTTSPTVKVRSSTQGRRTSITTLRGKGKARLKKIGWKPEVQARAGEERNLRHEYIREALERVNKGSRDADDFIAADRVRHMTPHDSVRWDQYLDDHKKWKTKK